MKKNKSSFSSSHQQVRLSSTSFASPLFYQISFLIKNLIKKNYKQTVSELNQVHASSSFRARALGFFYLSHPHSHETHI